MDITDTLPPFWQTSHLRIQGNVTSATTEIQWKSVIFEDEDWDTEAKINMLNQQDAIYNNILLAKIIELLK